MTILYLETPSHRDKIYVIGGNAGLNKRQDVIETEVYSPEFDQWTIVSPLPMGQSEAGAYVFQKKIYIVGGYCWSARRCVKIIQTYRLGVLVKLVKETLYTRS